MTSPERDPLKLLADCRAEIETLDQRLVTLLADRVALAKRAAALKREAGLPIVDPQREAEVMQHADALARELALPPDTVREIFARIVELSRRVQSLPGDRAMHNTDQTTE